jgi:Na+/proline symporter
MNCRPPRYSLQLVEVSNLVLWLPLWFRLGHGQLRCKSIAIRSNFSTLICHFTRLQSSAVAYNYGVSGPFWYASGATVQVILFATLAIELKRKAPNAHTFLEAIRARYGGITHCVFIVFGLMTNVLVTAMLLTGGSAVIKDLTGMNPVAACFLLPVGVVAYTMFGGIKATFITDWVHTVVILIIIFLFAFTAYLEALVLCTMHFWLLRLAILLRVMLKEAILL